MSATEQFRDNFSGVEPARGAGGGRRRLGGTIKTESPAIGSAAASEPTASDGVAGVLALAEELLVAHDRLVRMQRPPMLHVGLIVGNPDHQTGGPDRPFLQGQDVRHGSPPK